MVDRRRARSGNQDKGDADQGGRRRRPAPKKSSPLPLIAGLGALAILAVVLVFVLGGDDKNDANPAANGIARTDTVEPKTPSADDALFGDSGASAQDETNKEETRRRVVDREPKSIELGDLTEHVGRFYLSKEKEAEFKATIKEVKRFKNERWDISKELKDKALALAKAGRAANRDPFLKEGDNILRRLNNRFAKSELHMDKDGAKVETPFMGFKDRPYALFIQNDGSGDTDAQGKKAVDLFRQLKGAFDAYYGEFIDLAAKKAEKKASANKHAIKVILLRTHGDYLNYNRIRNPKQDIPGALAHFEPDTGTLVVPLNYGKTGKDAEAQYREVLLHEGTHQLMNFYTGTSHLGYTGSMWSDEGVAEYFAGHILGDDGKIIFGRMNSRISSLEGSAAKRFRVPLTEMVRFSREAQKKLQDRGDHRERNRLTQAVYANGWAMVYFMNNFDGGKYRKKLQQVLKLQLEEGDCGLPALRGSVFPGDEEWDEFSREFDAYQDWIAIARKKGGVKNGIISDPS